MSIKLYMSIKLFKKLVDAGKLRHGLTTSRSTHQGVSGWILDSTPLWTPYHPSGSSQCTSHKHPASCIEPGLATRFIYIIHISMPFSQIIPPSPFPKTILNTWKFMVHVLLKPGLENFEHYFTSVWDECNCAVVWAFFGIAFLWDWNENWPFFITQETYLIC